MKDVAYFVGSCFDERRGREFGELYWFWLPGNGEIAAMKFVAENLRGFLAGKVFADPKHMLDVVVGGDESLDGELSFDDEVLRAFPLGEKLAPV